MVDDQKLSPLTIANFHKKDPLLGKELLKNDILFSCVLQLRLTHNICKLAHKLGQELINFTYKWGAHVYIWPS